MPLHGATGSFTMQRWGASAARDVSMTLYDRYGGYETFSRIVESFYRAVLRESSLQPYFTGVDMQRLMTHQTQFLAVALGGPVTYDGRSLADAHRRLRIQEADFNLVAELLVEALEDGGMAADDIETVVGIVLGTRAQIVAPAA
jgi:hemoglobin